MKNLYVNGWRKPAAYEASHFERKMASISFDAKLVGTKIRYVTIGSLLVTQTLPDLPSSDDNLENMLISNCLERLKQQQVNLAVAFAERAKTVEHLASVMKRLISAYTDVRKGRFGKALETLAVSHKFRKGAKDLAGRWLELLYAWLPLVNDIYGLANELSMVHRHEGLLFSVRSSARLQQTSSRFLQIAPGGTFGYSGRVWLNTTVDQKVSLWYKLDDAAMAALARNGLSNPALVAWEVVPFSFVIDWMLPLGSLLDSIDATVGFQYLGGSHTFFSRYAESGILDADPADGYKIVATPLPHQLTGIQMKRKVYDASPKPGVFYKNPFSSTHMVTAVALMLNAKKLYRS